MKLSRAFFAWLALASILALSLACARTQQSDEPSFWSISGQTAPTAAVVTSEPTAEALGMPTRRPPGSPLFTPTPDSPHELPALRTDPDSYQVQAGDTLGQIAARYEISVDELVKVNELLSPDVLEIGQQLVIPAPTPAERGPVFKVIPDSELVYGPASVLFNLEDFVQTQGGYLASYREEVNEKSLTGAQIVQGVAEDFSVNPRLLLAVLEHQGGWVTIPSPETAAQEYPIGWKDPSRKGLYRQLSWAANNLNRGYYLWQVGGVGAWVLADGNIVPVAPTINAGTAAVQQFYALLDERADWMEDVTGNGLFATYNRLFGYPFDYAIEPLVPYNTTQPTLQLPFEAGLQWAFTGGPHGGWGDGSGWAALDFAPPGDAVGCVQSNEWLAASADGLILRAENGAVIQDLDGDGLEQTGWVLLYMHVETRDRVQAGTFVKAGDRIGHPSCEGGVSNGTHVHLARRYNGEWIPADQGIPFVLDGWISSGTGAEYDGYMRRSVTVIEAYAGRSDTNLIER